MSHWISTRTSFFKNNNQYWSKNMPMSISRSNRFRWTSSRRRDRFDLTVSFYWFSSCLSIYHDDNPSNWNLTRAQHERVIRSSSGASTNRFRSFLHPWQFSPSSYSMDTCWLLSWSFLCKRRFHLLSSFVFYRKYIYYFFLYNPIRECPSLLVIDS